MPLLRSCAVKELQVQRLQEKGGRMKIIIGFVIPFCFGFIASGAFRNGDIAIVMVAIIGYIADLSLIFLSRR